MDFTTNITKRATISDILLEKELKSYTEPTDGSRC